MLPQLVEQEAKRLVFSSGCLSPSDRWELAQCSPMSLRKVVCLAEDRGCCEKGGSRDSITESESESTGTISRAAPGRKVAYGISRGK